jgi:hypothetical protein
MIIANPIYDEYFKRLMAHEHIAKFFIGTLLKCEVKSVQFRPQEFTYIGKDKNGKAVKLYRVDFVAVIKGADDQEKKVLIEVQKAHKHTALARFRGYLGEHYKDADPNEVDPLPIITIYILGFNLPDIKLPCFKVGRQYTDLFTGEISTERSHFMERLTHDSYVVQASRIPEHRGRNPLNELLDIFEQRHFTSADETEKNFPYDSSIKGVRDMCKVLSGLVVDPKAREEVAKELEFERILNAGYRGLDNEIAEAKAEIEAKDKALEEMAKALTAEKAKNAEKDKLFAALAARVTAIEQRNNS